MCQRVELLLLSCLLLTFDSSTGQILPPQNLSLVWKNDFYPSFSWQPPQHSLTNCTYEATMSTKEESIREVLNSQETHYNDHVIMDGGDLDFSVKTICNGNLKSEAAAIRVSYPDMVTKLGCYSYTAAKVFCSWSPVGNRRDLRFYYSVVNEDGPGSSTELQECQSYEPSGDVKTRCDLNATTLQSILIVLNATVNNTLARNTFKKWPMCSVKIPSLSWTVTKNKDGLHVSWVPPEMLKLDFWTFKVHYNECETEKAITLLNRTSYQINAVPHCQYCIWIELSSNLECAPITEDPRSKALLVSEEKCFDPDVEFDPLVLAAVFIPLVFAFLAVLIFFCCWRNKDNIFPKVPEPRDLITDISDNNNESSFCKLYIPAKEEEEDCKVTLIADTQTNKPDC